jgi:cytochrome P450
LNSLAGIIQFAAELLQGCDGFGGRSAPRAIEEGRMTAVADSKPRIAPGPLALPVLGNPVWALRRDLHNVIHHHWREHGDIVRFKIGSRTAHLLARPEHVEHVIKHPEIYSKTKSYENVRRIMGQSLVAATGELWKTQRRIIQPQFTPKKVETSAPLIAAATERMVARWSDGSVIDVQSEFWQLVMEILWTTLFSRQLSLEVARAFTQTIEHMARRMMFPLPDSLPTPGNLRFKKNINVIDDYIRGVIEERKNATQQVDDWLTRMILAVDEESNRQMSAQQLHDEVKNLFFGGQRSTVAGFAWLFWALDRFPGVREKLRHELDSVLNHRTPTPEDLEKLPYTMQVIQESLRLNPPLPAYVRDVLMEDVVDNVLLPADSMVFICPYVTHRHPEFWKEPETFTPERFSPENSQERPRYAYLPFGAGPRVCIGNHFTYLLMHIVLAMVAQKVNLRIVPNGPVIQRTVPQLWARDGLYMQIERRR